MPFRTGVGESIVVDKWTEIEQRLNNYLDKIGLNIKKSNVDEHLNRDADELSKLSKEECDRSAVILTQYAIYLQKEHNRHLAKYNWAKDSLELVIGNCAKSYGDKYTKYEEKRAAIISSDSYASTLYNMMRDINTVINDLDNMTNRINNLAQRYADMSRGKK